MSARRARTPNRARNTSTLSSKRVFLALALLMVAIVGQRSGRAADVPDALPYSLSYTVTGDYAVGSVDLLPAPHSNGFQTAKLHMGTDQMRLLPQNAEVLAASLYWKTLAPLPDPITGALPQEVRGAEFRGVPVNFVRTAARELSGVYAPCWSHSGQWVYEMRADVL